MKVDYLVKNAKIFTSDEKQPYAEAFAVRNGKFVYVGDAAGLAGYEGEIRDLSGKFIMPGIIDPHVHICTSAANYYSEGMDVIPETGKKECLAYIAEAVAKNPEKAEYRFFMGLSQLQGEKLRKEELDAICAEKNILILESEAHSIWCNSRVLRENGITEDTPDIAPGLSYYERDENGKLTGYLVEMTEVPIAMADAAKVTKEQIRNFLTDFFRYEAAHGVTVMFEAGTPGALDFHERVYQVMCEMDREGKLPVTIEGSYSLYDERQFSGAVDVLKEYSVRFRTPHVKVRTMKIMLDGTLAIHTACLVNPYADTGTRGGTVVSTERLTAFLLELNEAGFDLHVHTVGEGAVREVLDAVENAKKKLGDSFRIHVTCAHIEIMCDEDMNRFRELDVTPDFTPFWHGGNCVSGGHRKAVELLGAERADKMYRCMTMWDTGAEVTWSSDSVSFGKAFLDTWNPFVGMEVGMTRKDVNLAAVPGDYSTAEFWPQEKECIPMDRMLLGYTINAAKQLRLDADKGSVEAGKDADYLVFEKDLFAVTTAELRHTVPQEVVTAGRTIR